MVVGQGKLQPQKFGAAESQLKRLHQHACTKHSICYMYLFHALTMHAALYMHIFLLPNTMVNMQRTPTYDTDAP